jgi:hypothetical protein
MSSSPDVALIGLHLVAKRTSAVEDTCSIGWDFALDWERNWRVLLIIGVELSPSVKK